MSYLYTIKIINTKIIGKYLKENKINVVGYYSKKRHFLQILNNFKT